MDKNHLYYKDVEDTFLPRAYSRGIADHPEWDPDSKWWAKGDMLHIEAVLTVEPTKTLYPPE